jgi:hypothetical protein
MCSEFLTSLEVCLLQILADTLKRSAVAHSGFYFVGRYVLKAFYDITSETKVVMMIGEGKLCCPSHEICFS